MRLSVSDLETFRYYKERDDRSLDDLLKDLAHVSPPTRKMLAGKALASFFEYADDGEVDTIESCGWTFTFAIEGDEPFPLITAREVKAECVFQTSVGPVTLVGRVDSIWGKTVRDQKLTDRFDAERYMDSLQWRAYLSMFKAAKFVYDVFVGKIDDDSDSVRVFEYHPFPVYAYPGMDVDVARAVEELAVVVAKHSDIIEELKRKAQP